MKLTRFEDLECWQQAVDLAVDIYRVSGTGELCRDFGLRNPFPCFAPFSLSLVPARLADIFPAFRAFLALLAEIFPAFCTFLARLAFPARLAEIQNA